MYKSIDHALSEVLGIDLEYVSPSTSVQGAWLVAEKMMAKGFGVLIRNCTGTHCNGINSGIAREGDFFCNVTVDNGAFQPKAKHPVYAKTMPLAVSLASLKALGINPYTLELRS